ncbi:hypothetical protein [Teredinibacter purpureus]|uniref:hypothetical protein n=1 Tax=Teredinibacter purpureus TaxID=2731756 RepID=UPI0005F80816|nr:hypothetical protein [Teredinibacter purpureus]
MRERWSFKSIIAISLIGFLSVLLAMSYNSILLGFVVFIFGFFFWILLVNYLSVVLCGREFKCFIYQVGEERDVPNIEIYANGWFVYKEYKDLATVFVTNEGLHIYRMGLCSVHLGWNSFERIIIHNEKSPLMATVEIFKNGLRNRDLLIPWDVQLTEMLPSSKV